ncbi:hypothetical protein D3C81_1063260 [compost metagenome]
MEAAELDKVVGADGVVTLGLTDLPDAGGGTLQKTLRDEFGRLAGTSAATTDDLGEGTDNLYYTDAQADARAAVAVAAHVAEADPHAQYQMKLPTGTTGQFWRGDGAWSNTIDGALESTGDILSGESFIGSAGYLGMAARSPGGIVAIRPNGPANASGQFYVDSAGNMIPGGACYPTLDGVYPAGESFARWSVVYAMTGTINTSDAREKTPVRPLTDAEIAAAVELGGEIGVYQWLAMIEQKGGAAREHVGQAVQRAIAVMQSHGLDPFRYGFICYDAWEESAAIVRDGGLEISSARPAGDRYSFRMDELLAFIAAGERAVRIAANAELHVLIAAMEQRLAAAGL